MRKFSVISVAKGVDVSPALSVSVSPCQSYRSANPVFLAAQPAVLVDLWASFRPPYFKGFSVSMGVNNVFDNRLDLIQPYQGGKPPMRAFDREIGLRLGYDTP